MKTEQCNNENNQLKHFACGMFTKTAEGIYTWVNGALLQRHQLIDAASSESKLGCRLSFREKQCLRNLVKGMTAFESAGNFAFGNF